MGKLKWLFFDIGSTLVDESLQEAYIVQTVRECFADLHIHYSDDDIYWAMRTASKQYQSPVKAAIRSLAKGEEQALSVLSKAKYLHELERLYPDAERTLTALHQNYRLGIIANQAAGAQERLNQHGLGHFFSAFALSAERGVSKPDHELFLAALKETGCPAQSAAYIGDRLDNDIYPAKSLGFMTVRILQGLAKTQVPKSCEYEPDITVESLGQLLRIF